MHFLVPTTTKTQTTTTTTRTATTTTITEAPEEPGDDFSFNWDHFGNVVVGLMLHDFILICVVAVILLILRFVVGYNWFSKRPISSLNLSKA